MVLVAILSVRTGAWSYIPQMHCQAYFNDVHAKTYSHVMTAPPPQCTAFTSSIDCCVVNSTGIDAWLVIGRGL